MPYHTVVIHDNIMSIECEVCRLDLPKVLEVYTDIFREMLVSEGYLTFFRMKSILCLPADEKDKIYAIRYVDGYDIKARFVHRDYDRTDHYEITYEKDS